MSSLGSHSVSALDGTPFATCPQVLDLGRAVDPGIEPFANRSHVVQRPINAHLDFPGELGEGLSA
jgi:hypothetical protein